MNTPKQPYHALEITDNRASLYIAGEKRAQAEIEKIDRIYLAWWRSQPFVAFEEGPYVVAVLRDEAWVLPADLAGFEDLLFGSNFELLVAAAKFYQGLTPPPFRWRKKSWLCDVFLGIHPARTVPRAWRSKPSLLREEIRSNTLWTHYGKFLYRDLDNLIGGWFHQDFDIEGSTLDEVLAAYKRVHSLEDLRRTRADIQKFLEKRHDRQVKDDFVRLFRPDVEPEAWDGGMTTRQWLLRIAELLQ